MPMRRAFPPDFLIRRTAGNVVELAGIASFHASPVWVLAALADVAGAGRELIGEIAEALQKEGLMPLGQILTRLTSCLTVWSGLPGG